MSIHSKFISIVKPGIIFGNVVTLCGGFFLASTGPFQFSRLLMSVIGMSLVIASGCVFNNYIDRDIDQLMERTRHRVLAEGRMPVALALAYALVLGLIGFFILWRYTNMLTLALAALGFVVYVGVYSLAMKRRSVYGTAIGGIAGAIPPVVGYTAVSNHFDSGAVILFLMLFFWQIPHSYAIAIYRLKDYTAAAIPVLPVRVGIAVTKKSMLAYVIAFLLVSLLPSVFGYTGVIYFIVALGLGGVWVYLGIQGLRVQDDSIWARKMFAFSILNITLLCVMMSVKI